jgi:phosphomannomutase
MEKDYKFLVFDVDNTITESCTEITDDMATTLNRLEQQLVFISGTHIPELKRMVSSKLNRGHHLLGNVGTHYVLISPGSEQEIYNKKLTESEMQEIVSAIEKLKKKYHLRPLTSKEDQVQNRGSQITLSILGRNAPRENKAPYDIDQQKRKEFVGFLEKILGEDKYEFGIGGTTSIDITHKGNDKGVALEIFIKELDISKEDLLFFGDQLSPGGNDYPVIRTGIKCIRVKNPEETLEILKTI